MVEWTEDRIRYEAAQRHAEIIIQCAGLEDNSRSVATPGQKPSEIKEEVDDEKEPGPK